MAQVVSTSPVEIARVAFGVRAQPAWKIVDQLGGVVDRILNSSTFTRTFFPKTRVEGSTWTLLNPDTGDNVSLSERECILSVAVASRDLDRVRNLAGNFEASILMPLYKAGMSGVVRYGFLIDLADNPNVTLSPRDRFVPDESATSMDLRFTKRLPCLEARAKKDVEDFRNLIYLISEDEAGSANFLVDYQEMFEPALDRSEIERTRFTRFIDDGVSFYKREYLRWLSTFARTEAA